MQLLASLNPHLTLSIFVYHGYATIIVPKPLFLSLNWSLIVVLMRGKWYKTKILLNLSLIVIHWQFYYGFPAPLAARVSLPFHLHAKTKIDKKKAYSCFMMTNIIL